MPDVETAAEAAAADAVALCSKSPVPSQTMAHDTAHTLFGARKVSDSGALGSLLARQRAEKVALAGSRPSRHGNFGGAFRVHTVFGTQHVAHQLSSSGEAMLAVLSPTTRTLGPVFLDQIRGAVMGAPLPFGASVLIAWPQTVGLIACSIVLFVAGYVLFQRQEVRA